MKELIFFLVGLLLGGEVIFWYLDKEIIQPLIKETKIQSEGWGKTLELCNKLVNQTKS